MRAGFDMESVVLSREASTLRVSRKYVKGNKVWQLICNFEFNTEEYNCKPSIEENTMRDNELPWDGSTEVYSTIWWQALLAMIRTKESKRQLIQGIAQKSGLLPEEVELIFLSTVRFMTGRTLPN